MDSTASFRACLVYLFIFLTFVIQGALPRSTEGNGETRVKRETSDIGPPLPYVEGRTHPASEPLNPNTATGEGPGSQELFGGNFEASHTIFQPEVREGGAEEDEIAANPRQDPTSDTENDGGRGYSAQYPYTTTDSQSVNGNVRGTAGDYVPGAFDRPEYVPGYVEAYGESTGQQGGVGSDVQSGTSYHTESEPRTESQPRTESRRVVMRGGAGSSTRVYPTGAGSYPLDTGNPYPSSSGNYPSSSGTYPSSSGSYPTSGVDGYYTGSGQAYYPGTSGQGGTYYPGGTGGGNSQDYTPITSAISSNPNCPQTNVRVTINGLSCSAAIATLGAFVCYNHERSSTDCCERCLANKNPSRIGCEYGDRSYQCRNIQPFDCYVERNRQICCERCRQLEARIPQPINGGPDCRYGDLTPRCQTIQQRPHLCYLPENQRLCCVTCPRLANREEPDCRWGDQNTDLCQPFDSERRLRINCYVPAVRQVCCATCKSLRERIRPPLPGCEYGDNPVQFSTGRGVLDCREYVRLYGHESCSNPQVHRNCCFTCQRYLSGRG